MIAGLVDDYIKLLLIRLHVELILSAPVGLGLQDKGWLTATLGSIPFQTALHFCLFISVEEEG